MKARSKRTRWLLIALLFGFLAVAGLALVHHHGSRLIAATTDATAPAPVMLQQPHAAFRVSDGAWQPLRVPSPGDDDAPVVATHSNTQQLSATGHFDAPANTSSAAPVGSPVASSVGASRNVTPVQGNRPATSTGSQQPQDPANGYAYDSYAPLGCELPAGCGIPGGTNVIRQGSVTSGGIAVVHDSQDSTPDNQSSPPTNDNPPGGNNDQGTPGQPDPPGTSTVASAPELDPATLAGALTLLLGSLAVLRSRRVRVTR